MKLLRALLLSTCTTFSVAFTHHTSITSTVAARHSTDFMNKHHGNIFIKIKPMRRLAAAGERSPEGVPDTASEQQDVEATVQKYGLEAGLFQAFRNSRNSRNNTQESLNSSASGKLRPQDLLAKYGAAYLATSISLSVVSYALCYALVDAGIDVASLLEHIGIKTSYATSNAGTAAIAYAFHKAASPIRFPPTVALTPVVAGWLGRKPAAEHDGADDKYAQR